MEQEKLNKHYLEYDIFLKRSKKDFEGRYKAEFQPNALITDFQIIKTLGAGSFGRVMLVKHKTKGDKLWAMKCMDKMHVVKSKQVQHTMYEIRVLDAVKFDFIVGMEYFFKDNVYLFIVMPFINGGEMFSHLRNLKKFDETLAKFYAAQVVLAFEYLHFLGMVYRDLKPENILIDKDGYLKVTDLGFCKKIDDQRTYTLCGNLNLKFRASFTTTSARSTNRNARSPTVGIETRARFQTNLIFRYSRILGPGDNPESGLQQIGGLVGFWSFSLRNGGRISAILRQRPDENLRENSFRKIHKSRSFLQSFKGFSHKYPAS